MSVNMLTLNEMELTLVRTIGHGHEANGTVCQDYYYTKAIDEHTTLLAVADGHGGQHYRHSDIGAKLACEVLGECIDLKTIGSKQWILDLQQAWFAAIDRQPGDTDHSLYGTTLLFAVITDETIICGQIGDGAILLMNEHHGILHKPAHKKTNSLTHSMLESHVEDYFYVASYDRQLFPDVLLSTDGLFDPFPSATHFYDFATQVKYRQKQKDLEHPFQYYNYIMNDYTFDDCTYIFASSAFPAVDHYPEAALIAAKKGMALYETEDKFIRVRDRYTIGSVNDDLIAPMRITKKGNAYCYEYLKNEGDKLWSATYLFDDYLFETERDNALAITLHYTLRQFKEQLKSNGIHHSTSLKDALVISGQGEIRMFLDAIAGDEEDSDPLLGIITFKDHVYPITNQLDAHKRSIPFIELTSNEPFYQVIYEDSVHSYCLLNISSKTWVHRATNSDFPFAYALILLGCDLDVEGDLMHIELYNQKQK